jgi:hypothetical protein
VIAITSQSSRHDLTLHNRDYEDVVYLKIQMNFPSARKESDFEIDSILMRRYPTKWYIGFDEIKEELWSS